MTSIKTLMLGLSATALTIGGVAVAQSPTPGMQRPDRDATVTRAEAEARAKDMFARLDVNKDGKLDKADRELMHQQMREKMFAKLDTNGDGTISKAEFMADRGPEGRGPGMDGPPPPPQGDEGMDGPPPPGNDGKQGPMAGKLRGGPDKFRHGPGHGRRGHGGPGFGMMKDANKDGVVTQAEFVAAALKRFDAQDTNHDGKVTKEERAAAHEARKAERQAKRADRKAAK